MTELNPDVAQALDDITLRMTSGLHLEEVLQSITDLLDEAVGGKGPPSSSGSIRTRCARVCRS